MLVRMQAALEDVAVEDSIGRYIVDAHRGHPRARPVLVGASPRGSLALLLLARARAALAGRDYVIPEDVKEVAVPALAHRITLRPEMWLRRVDPAVRGDRGAGQDPDAGQRRPASYARPAPAPSPRAGSSPHPGPQPRPEPRHDRAGQRLVLSAARYRRGPG